MCGELSRVKIWKVASGDGFLNSPFRKLTGVSSLYIRLAGYFKQMSRVFLVTGAAILLALGAVVSLSCTPATPAPSATTAQPNSNSTPTSTTPTPGASLTISVAELKQKLESGYSFVLIDVRPREAFDKNHIEKALSMPLSEIPSRYVELPRGMEVVIYAECA